MVAFKTTSMVLTLINYLFNVLTYLHNVLHVIDKSMSYMFTINGSVISVIRNICLSSRLLHINRGLRDGGENDKRKHVNLTGG